MMLPIFLLFPEAGGGVEVSFPKKNQKKKKKKKKKKLKKRAMIDKTKSGPFLDFS